MKRILLASLPIALLALTACSGSDSTTAARVNGEEIDDRSFVDELKAYQDNELYQSGASTAVEGADGTVKADFARTALLTEIILTLARQEVEARGLDVSSVSPDAVTGLVNQIYAGDPAAGDVFAAFPEDFQEQARAEAANFVALQQSFEGDVTDAEVQAAYDEEPLRWASVCARHILVATEAEAQAVKERLDAGEDFADVAAEVSTDGSAASGGSLSGDGGACVPVTSFVEPFVQGAIGATVGEPTDPVQTDFGWHIILVDEWEDASFEDAAPSVRDQLERAAQANGSTALNDWLSAELKGDIWVNPRYGTFDPNTNRIIASGSEAIVPTTAP